LARLKAVSDVMVVFGRFIPWMVYAEDRDIVEFYFTVSNKPGQLMKAIEIFTKYKVNILNISAYALPDWDRAPVFIFADFTDLDIDVGQIKGELELVTGGKVYLKTPPAKGFMMDEFAFPLYVFPGARSLIILEHDFQEMIRGLYEKLGETGAILIYHLAYSGGKLLAKYLSEKLGLKDTELLIEVLKVYQAGGWGRVELIRYDPLTMSIVLRLYDSIECKTFKGSDKPASQFIRGHLSGLLSGLLNADIRIIESKCIAKGDPYCEFHGGSVS